ncbi:DNA-3-methyladenine glycosylase I [Alteromonas sp. M12]|uniref:DNA-3-methyladenine glycosylase I n=1 Tax=Alteromonas sp. M12 TaxID=3135644 RepID=UPI00319E3210
MDTNRCSWVGKDPIYQEYHDKVWGRPVRDPIDLFAKLCLDGQQAGLSWITILKKQQNYEAAFHNFEPTKIVLFDDQDIERLMLDKGIVRNRLKIKSIINNAKAYLKMQEEGIEFDQFIWSFVGNKVITNHWVSASEVPTSTPKSEEMSKALKKKGFSFVGTTICYAFMQAVGLVNDHTTDCHCYKQA